MSCRDAPVIRCVILFIDVFDMDIQDRQDKKTVDIFSKNRISELVTFLHKLYTVAVGGLLPMYLYRSCFHTRRV